MSETTDWQRFFPLFLRYGLLPEPEGLKRRREELSAEFAEMESQSSRETSRRVIERDHAIASREDAVRAELDAAFHDIQNYRNWAPTGDDWMKLAVLLAIAHKEAGFEFTPPVEDKTADINWRRDGLMKLIMEVDEVKAAPAAKKAATLIAREQKAGRWMEYGEHNSASSLAAGFSTRNAARKKARQAVEETGGGNAGNGATYAEIGSGASEPDYLEAEFAADKALLQDQHRDRASLLPHELELWRSYTEHFKTICSEAMSLTQAKLD